MAEPNLSKIVNLIMENPSLIAEIKNLALGEDKKDDGKTDVINQKESDTEDIIVSEDRAADTTDESAQKASISDDTYTSIKSTGRARRNDLLSALKPYVSEKRSRAIGSMMSIADIIDIVKLR